jgi:hypothetical protein
LQTQCQEDVPQSLDWLGVEEFAGEVQGKARSIVAELVDQIVPIKAGNQADQLFDLSGLHHRALLTLDVRSKSAEDRKTVS